MYTFRPSLRFRRAVFGPMFGRQVLVGGDWLPWILYFPILILGISMNFDYHPNEVIFFRGVARNHQPDLLMYPICFYIFCLFWANESQHLFREEISKSHGLTTSSKKWWNNFGILHSMFVKWCNCRFVMFCLFSPKTGIVLHKHSFFQPTSKSQSARAHTWQDEC